MLEQLHWPLQGATSVSFSAAPRAGSQQSTRVDRRQERKSNLLDDGAKIGLNSHLFAADDIAHRTVLLVGEESKSISSKKEISQILDDDAKSRLKSCLFAADNKTHCAMLIVGK